MESDFGLNLMIDLHGLTSFRCLKALVNKVFEDGEGWCKSFT